MKRLLFVFLMFVFTLSCAFADSAQLRNYNEIEIPKGTFIPVISTQEISTAYIDVGTKVKFIATTDLYLYDTNVIPRQSEFQGYIDKINEPVIGTNASMIIKVSKLKLPDGFEIPMKGYICVNGNYLIGGELTPPASYDRKPSFRQGYIPQVGLVPGPTRQMGEHKVIASGADLMIMLAGPLYITHVVNN